MQVSSKPVYERIPLDKYLASAYDALPSRQLSPVKQAVVVKPEEEIALAGGCWVCTDSSKSLLSLVQRVAGNDIYLLICCLFL